MSIAIRRAIITDANVIAAVHIASWQAIYRGHIADSVLGNLSLLSRTEEWRQRLQTELEVWVSEYNNNIVGFISIGPTRDVDDDPAKVVEMSAIYLLPEFWHKGLGTGLVQTVLLAAVQKDYKEMTLWVLESNKQARQFYEKLGFRATTDIKTDHLGCESLRVVRYRKLLI